MASRTRTLKIGADLDDAAELLAKKNGYPSGAAFIKGLIRHAAACQSKHGVTVPWSKLDLEDQDRLDAAILKRVKAGKGMTSAELAEWDWRAEVL